MHNIKEIIQKTAKFVVDNDKLPIPVLAARARKAAQNDPTDVSVVMASKILTKMASNNLFIKREDLKKLCDKLYSNNSSLNDIFAAEIGKTQLQAPKTMKTEDELDYKQTYAKIANPLLSNALEGAFEGKHKIYSVEDAKKAHKSCQAGLFAAGFEPKDIETFAGQEDIIICNAVYETPKGKSHVLVPIELKAGRALLPTMFLGEHGFVDLSKETLKQHILRMAGKSYKVNGNGLLKVLSSAKNGVKKIANDIEMAAMRINLRKSSAVDPNGIVGIEFFEEGSVVPEPEFIKDPEHEKFAERLNKPDGIARFVHSNKLVDAGRDVVLRKMAQFGYKNVQVSVCGVKENIISYAVAIGAQTGIKVPVKLANNKVLEPGVFLAEGSIKDFTQKEVSSVVKNGVGDKRALAVASPNFGMSPEVLVREAKQAIDEANYIKAEDIINVLGETSKHAQNLVISYMMSVLSSSNADTKKIEKAASKLDEPLPIAFSAYNIFYPKGA